MTDSARASSVLVIGGSSGFGFSLAEQLLGFGSSVTIVGRSEKRLITAVERLRSAAQREACVSGEVLDASDEPSLSAFFDRCEAYDHVVSMLGGAMGGGFMDNSNSDIRAAVDNKFGAALTVAKCAVKHIKSGGSLTFTAGSGGHPYDASGAVVGNTAVELLVKGLAVELAPNIRVNAIAPFWTPTGLWRDMDRDELERQTAAAAESVPLKRVASVEEVASAYVFAMQCGYLTGQTLHIDGGVSALG